MARVYLLQAHRLGFPTPEHKIGHTARAVEERIRELQTGNAFALHCLHTVDVPDVAAARTCERRLHRRFAARRGVGEWFTFEAAMLPDVRAAMDQEAAASQQPSPPPPSLRPPPSAVDVASSPLAIRHHRRRCALGPEVLSRDRPKNRRLTPEFLLTHAAALEGIHVRPGHLACSACYARAREGRLKAHWSSWLATHA
jgi:hypothetical protein